MRQQPPCHLLKVLAGTLGILACANGNSQKTGNQPADRKATNETINLYSNLQRLVSKGIMFGHQDDLAYGVGWKYISGKSDVKETCGDYPAVYGWDLGGIEKKDNIKNLDDVPFDSIASYIRQAYKRGGLVTLSWHMSSPLGAAKGAWDTTHGTVASILPGGTNHLLFRQWLDRAAAFISSLKGSRGEAIPLLFRPFHELTGNWFWWGSTACTPAEFRQLWHFTLEYLQTDKNIHSLLYVYNTSGDFKSQQVFLERYPGDAAADMLSFDTYQYDDPVVSNSFIKSTAASLQILEDAGREHKKLIALAETGYEAIPYARWWTETLLKAIGTHPISYVLLWRNHGYHESMKKMHYYVPYKEQVSEPDFKTFYGLDNTLFEKDIAKAKLYAATHQAAK